MARVVAVLHDVVEDCEGWTFERLREEGFSPAVIKALELVTKRDDGEDYIGLHQAIRSERDRAPREDGGSERQHGYVPDSLPDRT